MNNKIPTIDADSHVSESNLTWEKMDEEFYDRRPMKIQLENRKFLGGVDLCWLFDGKVAPQIGGHGSTPLMVSPAEATVYRSYNISRESAEMNPVEERIKRLDAEGIHRQVLNPSIARSLASGDARLRYALCRCVNDWLNEICSKYPERLAWNGIVPIQHTQFAVEELRRMKKMGAAGCIIPGTAGSKPLHSWELDPFWAEAEKNDIPIQVHPSASWLPLRDMFDTTYAARNLSGRTPVIMGFFSMLGGGILERFPKLRVLFAEMGIEWVPYWLRRMDNNYESESPAWGKPKKKPGTMLQECEVYFAIATDDDLEHGGKIVSEDRLVFGMDMPHPEESGKFATMEGSVSKFLRKPELSDSAKEKILFTNAVRYFGF